MGNISKLQKVKVIFLDEKHSPYDPKTGRKKLSKMQKVKVRFLDQKHCPYKLKIKNSNHQIFKKTQHVNEHDEWVNKNRNHNFKLKKYGRNKEIEYQPLQQFIKESMEGI